MPFWRNLALSLNFTLDSTEEDKDLSNSSNFVEFGGVWWSLVESGGGVWWSLVEFGGVEFGRVWWSLVEFGGGWWSLVEVGGVW